MKTRFALSAVIALMIITSGNIVWAQGRGNGHDRGGHHKGGERGNGRGNGKSNHHDNNRYHSERYHHTDHNYYHHNNHHHSKKIVVVHRPAPVVVVHRPAPVVVHHHHHHAYHEPRYVYYRDYDVYYDNTRRVYISFSGRNWSVSTEIPVRMYYADRGTIVSTNVDYYDDDFAGYLDNRRPGGRHCDEW
ncbi:hypothetical protein [Pseudochryseolinea flava]|uniref:Uncharacterized protein n=1 Tax=Pseudochryseolinea flava TaxID=2059302 RepID=A0A364Y831_9BACT|nr:hypothetical protein [Pseudochryseolinea flava]RAW03241.1 hypothetical protein DQQ10_03910 [Pseudochryseolinea flava]